MNVDAIRAAWRKRPFAPFELKVAGGERFRVAHPEALFVHELMIVAVDEDGLPTWIDPPHVISLRRLRVPAPRSDGNSRGKK